MNLGLCVDMDSMVLRQVPPATKYLRQEETSRCDRKVNEASPLTNSGEGSTANDEAFPIAGTDRFSKVIGFLCRQLHRETLEKANPNEASLVRGWQKMHMKNGKWCNQKAEDDDVSGIQLMQ
ncbi:hypothetical protein L2E82_11381 [Cichorium intybus]|uniref:Uncharacterized protein n=1 Tax=Cichorium intybus TaxID=13427 RepID=A0ACB9GE88_CICIN|nr:hypothetical protein L2E82_11381 [Cichorium intybus]